MYIMLHVPVLASTLGLSLQKSANGNSNTSQKRSSDQNSNGNSYCKVQKLLTSKLQPLLLVQLGTNIVLLLILLCGLSFLLSIFVQTKRFTGQGRQTEASD